MKKIFLMAVTILFFASLSGFAQDQKPVEKKEIPKTTNVVNQGAVKPAGQHPSVVEPPAVVKAKLTSLYPDVKDVRWAMRKSDYRAMFSNKEVRTSVLFDPNGEVLETETNILSSTLPKAINEYIATTYPDKKMSEHARMKDAKGVVTYEVGVDKQELVFDSSGKFIKSKEKNIPPPSSVKHGGAKPGTGQKAGGTKEVNPVAKPAEPVKK
jgi:hypothetical protein